MINQVVYFRWQKIILLWATIISVSASATVGITQDDLVGTWKCLTEYQDEYGVEKITTLDKMNADGTMTQLIESVYDDKSNHGLDDGIRVSVISSNWQFNHNRLNMINNVVNYYRGFDNKNMPYSPLQQNILKTSFEYDLSDDGYKIKIIDKNFFYFFIEDIDVAINFAYCQRML